MSGKGQGSAGAINEEGGTFGKLEVAREAEYFYKQVRHQSSINKYKGFQHSIRLNRFYRFIEDRF